MRSCLYNDHAAVQYCDYLIMRLGSYSEELIAGAKLLPVQQRRVGG